MSYNPSRLKKQNRGQANRPPVPKNVGRKHSDVMKERGVGIATPIGDRQPTEYGWSIDMFSGSKFVQRYECMHPGNKTDFGINRRADRTIYVSQGQVWVITAKVSKQNKITSAQTQTKVHAGGSIKLPKGTGYALATSGNSIVELIVTEDPEYDESWKAIKDGVTNIDSELLVLQSNTERPGGEVAKKSRRRPRSQNKAMRQARQAQQQQRAQSLGVGPSEEVEVVGNVDASDNANSVSSTGVNPRPMFPTGG